MIDGLEEPFVDAGARNDTQFENQLFDDDNDTDNMNRLESSSDTISSLDVRPASDSGDAGHSFRSAHERLASREKLQLEDDCELLASAAGHSFRDEAAEGGARPVLHLYGRHPEKNCAEARALRDLFFL